MKWGITVVAAITVVLAAVGIVMSVTLSGMNAATSQMSATNKDVGALQEGQNSLRREMVAAIDLLRGEMALLRTDLTARMDAQEKIMNSIQLDLHRNVAQVTDIAYRQTINEQNPSQVLTSMGIAIQDGYSAMFVEGQLYVFPHHEEAEQALLERGFSRQELATWLAGYTLVSNQ